MPRITREPITRNVAILAIALVAVEHALADRAELPNVVIVFTDDQGYADVGCFGAKGFRTPNLDRMAHEGVRMTNFHVAQPVCSASRAALLTGCYANRVGIHGALGPLSRVGIHEDEMTIAELVKQKGYATAIYGKWHLGDHRKFLPVNHGFDDYFGLPYSNDMWPYHPTAPKGRYPHLPLVEDDCVLMRNPDQTQLTTWYTERAVKFIEENRDRPFFLYVPHSMPHVPLFVSEKFQGKTEQGIYGDVIAEIDWSVGEILRALEKHGLDEKTLVIYTSDNGPWLSYGTHGGSAEPLREGKGTAWEGGVRVPCIMRWPGKIPAGSVCDVPAMTIDILPTIARLIDAELPAHGVDGKDIWPLISGEPGARSPHDAYAIYYRRNELHAMISGHWKLYLPHSYRTLNGRRGGTGGRPVRYDTEHVDVVELYDLQSDIGETRDVADRHPDVVKRLLALAERAREDLGDRLTGRQGSGAREPGRVQWRR